ncbi:MAG: ATP-binding protein [Sterolibacterium sp.]
MKHHQLLSGVTIAVMFIWSASIVSILAWDWHDVHKHAEVLAKMEARIHFNKDLSFRRWATSHGGAYVPIDARTPPNPGLAHLPERDIQTPSGRKLTLMNPAYIMRQAMTDYADMFGVQGKLTSLRLINPDNAADAWETSALLQFEQGVQEVSEFTEVRGKPVLRLMGAIKAEAGCLKCHAFQGYKVGDVRGGVGVIVPMQAYLEDARSDFRKNLLPLGVIWVFGLSMLILLFLQLRRRLLEQQLAETELQKRNLTITRANADLTRFAEVSAHHLMEPTRRLTSYAQRLRSRLLNQPGLSEDEEARHALETLEHDAGHLRSLVRDIQLYLAAGVPRGEVGLEDTNAVVSAVEKRLADQIKELGVRLEIQTLPQAWLDRPRLTDLFAILLENALHHGRPIDPKLAQVIRIEGERIGGVSRYSVSDNGPGIGSEYLERVFEIFERLAPASIRVNDDSGTGIGLSIARRIIESRHGKIWIENSSQGGARVVFELPDGENS